MFFNPWQTPEISQRHLPHWNQDDVIYFVTFRLADSIPEEKLKQWRERRQLWEEANKAPLTRDQIEERDELFSKQIDCWLDQGSGSCLLQNPELSGIVSSAMHFFDGVRYQLEAYVVMPNHVHLMLQPRQSFTLSKILHSLKSYTANEINKYAKTTGNVWQEESYDRIIRNPEELSHFRAYIRRNPEVARVRLAVEALYLRE